MEKRLSFGNIELALAASRAPSASSEIKSKRFPILVLGDFSGRASRGVMDPACIAKCRPIEVDRDNVDDVMKKLQVAVELPVGSSGNSRMSVSCSELDDFHPDRLFGRLELFDRLRQTRRRLGNASTFEAAAAEIRAWGTAVPDQPVPKSPSPSVPAPLPENLLDLVVGGEGPNVALPRPAGSVDWNSMIQEIVGPYVVKATDARQPELLKIVDQIVGEEMRRILHHPEFQAIEAAWRGVDFLVRRLETDEELKVALVDISRDELVADLAASDDLSSTGLFKFLVEQTVGTPGGQPWAVLAGNYAFDATAEEIGVLGRLARIAKLARAPWLAAGTSRFLGCESIVATPDPDDWTIPLAGDEADAWRELRALPEADALSIALPRMLGRVPYGKSSNPTEQIAFEEMPTGHHHQAYHWLNPIFACACALGQGFSDRGWSLRPNTFVEFDRMPMHVYKEDGESAVKPCAEVLLTERASERIDHLGLVGLISVKGTDRLRVPGVRPVTTSTNGLFGRWRASN
ncbi:MAG: type VI secretion system contractile sheath large subunit [Planctomycetota bacterium]